MTRKILVWLHRWLGLIAGAFVFLQAATGVILLFRDELNCAVQPQAMCGGESGAAPSSLNALVEASEGRTIDRIELPSGRRGVIIVRYFPGADGRVAMMTVDPASSVVLSEGPLSSYPIESIFYFHYQLLAGATGQSIVGAFGVALAMLAVIGLCMWWPGRRRLWTSGFRVQNKGPLATRLFSWHRVGGAVVAIMILVVAISGALIAYYPATRAFIGRFLSVEQSAHLAATACPANERASLEELAGVARNWRPRDELWKIRFAKDASAPVRFQLLSRDARNPIGIDNVWIDLCTKRIVAEENALELPPGETLLRWLLPVHTGEIYGRVRVFVLSGVGIFTCFLYFSGVWMWLRRTLQRRRRSDRRSEPPLHAAKPAPD